MGIFGLLGGDSCSQTYDSPDEVVTVLEKIGAEDFHMYAHGGDDSQSSDIIEEPSWGLPEIPGRPANIPGQSMYEVLRYSPQGLEKKLANSPGSRYKIEVKESGEVAVGVSAFHLIPIARFEGEIEADVDMGYIRGTLSSDE